MGSDMGGESVTPLTMGEGLTPNGDPLWCESWLGRNHRGLSPTCAPCGEQRSAVVMETENINARCGGGEGCW